MRFSRLVGLLLAFGLATLVFVPIASSGGSEQPAGGALPSCVAGTYLGEVTLDNGLTFRSLNTLGADGTYVTESTIDFGASGAMAFRSGGRGQWRATGPRQLKTTYLHFAYDAAGDLVWLEKISAVVTFNGGCSSATGEATYAIYPPDGDPLGNEPPWVTGRATLAMKRLTLD